MEMFIILIGYDLWTTIHIYRNKPRYSEEICSYINIFSFFNNTYYTQRKLFGK